MKATTMRMKQYLLASVHDRQTRVLTEQQKYRKCFDMLVSIAQIMSELSQQEFDYNFQNLSTFKEYLTEGRNVVVCEVVGSKGINE